MKKKFNLVKIAILLPLVFLSSCDYELDDEDYVFDWSNIEEPEKEEDKRPVWLLKHRCNSNVGLEKSDVEVALEGGCNGVEVDIRYRKSDDSLVLSHDRLFLNKRETVEDFLSLDIMKDERMNLIVFDIKEPEQISNLIDVVHDFEIENNFYKINYVYSVAKLKDAVAYFPAIASKLENNEGVCVDFHPNAYEVEALYQSAGIKNCWYGDGIFFGSEAFGIKDGCCDAVSIRDAETGDSSIKKVENWTVQFAQDFYERLVYWKVDCLLLDSPLASKVTTLMNGARNIRIANRNDSPFENKK